MIEQLKEFGLHHTAICHVLSGKKGSAQDRFILPKNKHLMFVLVDLDTGEEFECISSKSIFIHLNMPYNENEAKYVYELRRPNSQQSNASICGRVLCLKNCKPRQAGRTMKNFSSEIEKKRREAKIQRGLANNVRRRLILALKAKGLNKKYKSSYMIGCSPKELRLYLESKFQNGMTWENYGKWHMDHIIPLSSFDLSKEEELLKAANYSNIQPLWAKDNYQKHSKLDWVQNSNNNPIKTY